MITRFTDFLTLFNRWLNSEPLAGIIAFAAIGLLVFLLVEKELLRAYWQERAARAMRFLNVVIVPLLVIFALIMASRLWHILQLAGVF